MDLLAGAASSVAGMLLHGKAKLVRADKEGGGGSGGLGGALLNAAASAVGLGAGDPDDEMTFMFNPTEYRISQSVDFNAPPRKALGEISLGEYLGTRQMSVSMQLFFDDFASAKGDVTPKITKLLKWQQPDKDGNPPPLVKFQWGNKQLENFQGMITQLNINYSVFAKDGTPLQAKVDLTLEGADDVEAGTNPTSHALDMRRVHTVVEGETIQSVAYDELGDPNYWRAIADVNTIDDPLRVRPGAALVIPSAADAARMA
jgi:Contractile injection system tube protein/LysM domain